jgi:hypothetical protein
MAYEFTAASSQHLNTSSAVATATPLTFACFFNSKTTQNGNLIVLSNNSANSNFALYKSTDSRIYAYANNGATFGQSFATGVTNNSWSHAAGVFTSSTSRLAYLNGAAGGTNTTNVTPAGINETLIGAGRSPSLGGYCNGFIAEVGIWNAALTAAEIASLAKGMTCDKVRPESLVFYAPLVRDLQDLSGGLTITNNNAATVATHPRVYA